MKTELELIEERTIYIDLYMYVDAIPAAPMYDNCCHVTIVASPTKSTTHMRSCMLLNWKCINH